MWISGFLLGIAFTIFVYLCYKFAKKIEGLGKD